MSEKRNWSKIQAQDLSRRHGHERYELAPDLGPCSTTRKKNTYPCLAQPPRQKKKPKPRMVKYVVLADRVPAPPPAPDGRAIRRRLADAATLYEEPPLGVTHET